MERSIGHERLTGAFSLWTIEDVMVLPGLAVKGTDAQNNRSEIEKIVEEWLKEIDA